MKNSGIEWIGEIPDSWHTLPLKRMVEKHFGGCWGEDAKNNDNDVLCIRIADFNFDNQTNKAILSVDEIGNIISIEKLSIFCCLFSKFSKIVSERK